jgi:CheY-like chemotaxis protein
MSTPRILIAEDSVQQANAMAKLLARQNYEVEIVRNGREALERLAIREPDVLIADLIMPEINGLKLVEMVRARHPRVPVVLMTNHGNEDIATAALQRGAMSYVPKRRLETDLVRTLQQVLGLARSDRRHKDLLDSLDETTSRFILRNDPSLFPHLISHIQDLLGLFDFGDEGLRIRIAVALTECLDNAHFHGNLELSSELREGDGEAWSSAARARRIEPPYRDRRIHVEVRIGRRQVEFKIRDEGPGFDVAKLVSPIDEDNIQRCSGRGIFLVKTFMDEVHHNEQGNEVRLVKHRPNV